MKKRFDPLQLQIWIGGAMIALAVVLAALRTC
jgi:hypothetical protein